MRYLLAILVLVVACGEKKPPRRPGDDYLKKIDVEGNRQIEDKQLVSGLALKRAQQRGRGPDPYLIQVDADRIRGEYLRKGYLGVDVRSRIERKGDAATVIYSVDEGIRATTRVVIKGLPDDPAISPAKVRAALPLRDGEPFDYLKYDLAKPLLIGILQDAGYAHARLEPTVWADRANGEAIVELEYDPGPKARFGEIKITGVDGKLAEAVRDRLAFATGDTYSSSAISQTQRQLYALQRFSTVQVTPDDTPDSTVEVKVAVSEAARHEIKLGGGAGVDPTAYEIRGRAGYSITGFPTQMDTLTLDFRPAYGYLRSGAGWEPRIRALARIERQDIFWAYSRGEVEGGYNYLAVEAWTSYGPRAQIGFGTPVFLQGLQLRLGWGLESLDFRNISPLLDEERRMDLRLGDTNRIGAYQQSLSLDLRDNPVDTRSGVYGELRVAEGTKFAGGNFDYVALIPEVRGFLPLGELLPVFGGVVLAGKGRVGAFWGEVPATERFMSGGASSHRGFGERKLSPYVRGDIDGTDTTVPYGGTSLVETSLEARIPLTTWKNMGIGTVLFLDGGDVTDEIGDIDVTNLHWAAGIGLRLLTIVGPVRADLGYRLNRTGAMEPSAGSRFAFHFSIGEAF